MCQSGATCLEWYLVDSGPGQGIGVERHVWSGIWLTQDQDNVSDWSGIWLTQDQDNVSEWSDMSGVVSG
jgi:hypothetical protein